LSKLAFSNPYLAADCFGSQTVPAKKKLIMKMGCFFKLRYFLKTNMTLDTLFYKKDNKKQALFKNSRVKKIQYIIQDSFLHILISVKHSEQGLLLLPGLGLVSSRYYQMTPRL